MSGPWPCGCWGGWTGRRGSKMRDYGVVHTKFWTEDDVQGLSDGAQLLFLYLLTGPHTTAAGCFRLPLAYISADRKWSTETVSERFAELSRNGFAYRCENTDWIIIPKFLKHNPIPNPNCGMAVAKALDSLPRSFSKLSLLIGMLEPFSNRMPNGFMNGLQNRMPNHEQNQEQEQDLRDRPSDEGRLSTSPPDGDPVDPPSQSEPETGQPAREDDAPQRARDDCPHAEIVALYHERLPTLPRVRVWGPENRTQLRSRWREDKGRQSLDWWQAYFDRVHASDFLCGRKAGSKGPFFASLSWLVNRTNLGKVLNGQFDNRGRGTGSRQADRNALAAQAFVMGE